MGMFGILGISGDGIRKKQTKTEALDLQRSRHVSSVPLAHLEQTGGKHGEEVLWKHQEDG